ncbi:elongin C, partial [Coemansia sp. RSA 2618]
MAGSTSTAVKLISGDGFSFIIDKVVDEQSPTLKNMLDTSRGGISGDVMFTEALSNQIQLPEIRGSTLEKVCQYLFYKYQFVDEGASDRVPEFDFDIE